MVNRRISISFPVLLQARCPHFPPFKHTDSEGAADGATLRDALHWARYAAAAFGKDGYLWTHEGSG